MANVLFVLLETCTVNTGFKHHNINLMNVIVKNYFFKTLPKYITKQEEYLKYQNDTCLTCKVYVTGILKAGAVSLFL